MLIVSVILLNILFGSHQRWFLNIKIWETSEVLGEWGFYLRKLNGSFISVVLIISCLIFFYSSYYIDQTKKSKIFTWLLLLFILAMCFLLLRSNIWRLFIGWDGLGVSSYCLVIYYLNWKSQNSGQLTILSNRVGDLFLLILLGLRIVENWTSQFSSSLGWKESSLVLLLFLAFTKRAQFPFSSWLPAAIAAPTPISSLVHSSTLVAAGVVLILLYLDYLPLMFSWILLARGLITMFYSGVFSLVERDLKKLVALSTLNQLAFIIVSLSLGLKILRFFHLVTHAFFKSLLFINVGGVLHLNFSTQDYRQHSNGGRYSPLILFRTILSLIRLIGLVFSTGFFSKDMILEKMWFSFGRQILILFLIVRVSFTFFYSFTIFRALFNITRGVLLSIHQSITLNVSLWVARLFRIFVGNMFWWNYMTRSLFWVVGIKMKLGFLLLLFLIGLNLLAKIKRMKVKFYLFNIGILNFIVTYLNKFFIPLIFLKNLLEKSWLERLERNFIYHRINKRALNFWGRIKFLWWFRILGLLAFLFLLLPK
jgi:NADH:ubiquinone oxidoreductase subunit 5 (subunit L)/multisubunit Na+/H+ antiporter MnhA subunit